MSSSVVYCDYNATAPLRPVAREAMLLALDIGANPSSVHAGGREARKVIEEARADIAEGFGVAPEKIVFTSGGTESVATALWGGRAVDPCLQLWAGGIEHESVLAQGVTRSLPVGSDGRLSLLELRKELHAVAGTGVRPFVSLMLANNETGIVQPVAEAAALVHQAGGLIHCDAVQAVGKIPVAPHIMDVDYVSISAHKIGGPQGVGAVIISDAAPFRSRQGGGGQESGRRAGTENLAGIAGFAAAFREAVSELDQMVTLADWRNAMEQDLCESVTDVCVYGLQSERLPNTSCFGLSGFPAQTQMMALDLAGVRVGSGSACSSGRVESSHVLQAMGVEEEASSCVIRASFGWASRSEDFTRLSEAWIEAVGRACPEAASVSGRS